MNDRFKFRVWDKKKKEWLNPSIIGINLNGEIIAPDDTYLNHNPTDLVLTQCTGLKDKNGKLIFEGDILTYEFEYEGENRRIYQKVSWTKWQPGFHLETYGSHLKEQGGSGGALHCMLTNIPYQLGYEEICGNVYENPKLVA